MENNMIKKFNQWVSEGQILHPLNAPTTELQQTYESISDVLITADSFKKLQAFDDLNIPHSIFTDIVFEAADAGYYTSDYEKATRGYPDTYYEPGEEAQPAQVSNELSFYVAFDKSIIDEAIIEYNSSSRDFTPDILDAISNSYNIAKTYNDLHLVSTADNYYVLKVYHYVEGFYFSKDDFELEHKSQVTNVRYIIKNGEEVHLDYSSDDDYNDVLNDDYDTYDVLVEYLGEYQGFIDPPDEREDYE